MGQIASLISLMELCQQWLYVINDKQNLNLANTWWDHYLAKFCQKVYENMCVWGRGYCQYQEGCACSFRTMPCPLHLSFGKEQKLSRDLYDELSWEWWYSKGTFTGAIGRASNHAYYTVRPVWNFPIPHTYTPHAPAASAAALFCMLP